MRILHAAGRNSFSSSNTTNKSSALCDGCGWTLCLQYCSPTTATASTREYYYLEKCPPAKRQSACACSAQAAGSTQGTPRDHDRGHAHQHEHILCVPVDHQQSKGDYQYSPSECRCGASKTLLRPRGQPSSHQKGSYRQSTTSSGGLFQVYYYY